MMIVHFSFVYLIYVVTLNKSMKSLSLPEIKNPKLKFLAFLIVPCSFTFEMNATVFIN